MAQFSSGIQVREENLSRDRHPEQCMRTRVLLLISEALDCPIATQDEEAASGSWMSSWKAAMRQTLKRKKLKSSLKSISAWHFLGWELGCRVYSSRAQGVGSNVGL